MQEIVNSFFDEWAEAIASPELQKKFAQFNNTTETLQNMELEEDRGQLRPVYWPQESVKEDFRNTKWTSLSWQPIIEASHFKGADEMPNGISANVKRGDTQLAIFRVKGKWLASQQMCPHKRAFVLSDGLIGDSKDKLWVSCPYHKRNYELNGEQAGRCQNDEEVSIAVFEVEEREDGMVYLKLPPVHELDGVLGTKKWMVRKEDSGEAPLAKMDRRLGANGVGMKGRRPFEAKREMVAGGPGGIDW